jgi:hypothetical protein
VGTARDTAATTRLVHHRWMGEEFIVDLLARMRVLRASC